MFCPECGREVYSFLTLTVAATVSFALGIVVSVTYFSMHEEPIYVTPNVEGFNLRLSLPPLNLPRMPYAIRIDLSEKVEKVELIGIYDTSKGTWFSPTKYRIGWNRTYIMVYFNDFHDLYFYSGCIVVYYPLTEKNLVNTILGDD